MCLKTNPILRLALIGATALSMLPALPSLALAAGGGVDRCVGTALIGTARLGGGRGEFFAGYVLVDAAGTFRWHCSTGAGVMTERANCGDTGTRFRFVTAEIRNGVVYVDCP